MPLYNRALYSGLEMVPIPPFPHPLAATALQFACVVLLLALLHAVQEFRRRRQRRGGVAQSVRYRTRVQDTYLSWITLVRHLALPSVALSGVVALSNVGVSLVAVALTPKYNYYHPH